MITNSPAYRFNWLLAFASAAEAVTGLALLGAPALVVMLLFGTELAGIGIVVGRIAGIALFALGLACWPAKLSSSAASCGMTIYNLLVALLLLDAGLRGESIGPLLWPSVVLHAALTCLLAYDWRNNGATRRQHAKPHDAANESDTAGGGLSASASRRDPER